MFSSGSFRNLSQMNCRTFRLLVLSWKHIMALANHKAYPSELFWNEALFNKMKANNYAMVVEVWCVCRTRNIFFLATHFSNPWSFCFPRNARFFYCCLFRLGGPDCRARNDRQREKDLNAFVKRENDSFSTDCFEAFIV
jgi:hypothetical protein